MSTSIAFLARRPRAWGRRVRWLRHGIQLAFALFIFDLALQHSLTPESSGNVVASPEAYCPLGGFESLYRFVTSGGYYLSHAHASNMVLAVGIVLSALATKAFFCGLICPFGSLQEGLTGLSRWVQRRVPGAGRAVRALRAWAAPLARLDPYLRYLRYLMLAWVLLGAATFGFMVFRQVDPYQALTTILEFELSGGLVVLGVVVVMSLVMDRPWCRYACPLGAIVGLVGRLSPLKIERLGAACLDCGLCSKGCPMGLAVDRLTRVDSPECISCLDCVGSCPTQGGLGLRLALPGLRPKPSLAVPVLNAPAAGQAAFAERGARP